MRRLALLPLLLVWVACGDDTPKRDLSDADTAQPDAADTTAPDADTTVPDTDTSPALTGCLLEPGALPAPPGETLPCELIPPGLVL